MSNFEYKIFKIPQIPNLVFAVSRNYWHLLPQRLLCSSEFGFFWYYGTGRPLYLSDGSDYEFSVMKEYDEYIFVQRLRLDDPDIANWNDISYSLEEVERHFTIPFDKYVVPKFTKENIQLTKVVLFKNGEYGEVVYTSRDDRFNVVLFNGNKSPNGRNEKLTQNYGDGKHTGHETTKLEWQVIHVL